MTHEQYTRATQIVADIKTTERAIERWNDMFNQGSVRLRILGQDGNYLPLFIPEATIIELNVKAAQEYLAELNKQLEQL